MEYSETYWLDELFHNNGIDRQKTDVKQIEELELFSSSIPQLPCMDVLSNLTVLRIVGCNMEKIEKLDSLENLTELWICEGGIKKLEGFHSNLALKKLFLYNNSIGKIENISHLTMLETLWLNKNKIEIIENLDELKQLKELNLSDNKISKIAQNIRSNILLEDLNLSGNNISSLQDITILSCLPNLISLGLKDPMSSPNPVAFLCNYLTYILYHLPSLKRLDLFDVSQKSLRDYAVSTVSKKKTFYKMKVKTLERSCTSMKVLCKEELKGLQEGPVLRLQRLINCKKEIEREIDDIEHNVTSKQKVENRDSPVDKDGDEEPNQSDDTTSQPSLRDLLISKLNKLTERIKYWETKHVKLNLSFKEVCKQAEKWKKNSINHLQLEFAFGGNIRFEEGSTADLWYKSCQDLVLSRFTCFEYKELKVTGIKVHSITRIQNHLSKMKFDLALDNLADADSACNIYKDTKGRRVMDYLFLKFDSKIPFSKSEVLKIMENGFNSQRSGHGTVQLTNSIYISDKHRIKYRMLKRKDLDNVDKCVFRFGQLLIFKVYLGKSCTYNKDKRFNQASYPNYHSVYQSKKHPVSSCSTKLKKGNSSLSEMCECAARRCTWFIFNSNFIQLEYIVDFEYQTTVTPPMVNVFSNIVTALKEGCIYQNLTQVHMKLESEQDYKDEEILNMVPDISTRPRLTILTGDLLLQQSGKASLNKIVELNLHGSGLSKVKLLANLVCLKKLILSFNELTSVYDFGGITSLEYLDISFNQICRLDGFKQLPNLMYLDISWNNLHYTRDEVGLMRKYLPALKILHTTHNPWIKEDSLRLRCIGRLHSLTTMNNAEVTTEETKTAFRLASNSRIAYITVLANSRTDEEPIQCLNLLKTTDVLMKYSTNKPVKLSEDDKLWIEKVTCLHLDGHHLSKISNLEKLENLKWASFNNNDITKVEGLDACKNLIELYLSGNCISKIDGINHLSKLEVLDVSNNVLSTLDGLHFDKLSNLKYLAFNNNCIHSLNGLQKSTSLLEMYAGNNKIQQIREIFYLKSIPSLMILDMFGNPLVEESRYYRLFVIYHLQNLKVLDGTRVDFTEGGIAKDTFGGKLSTDFIAEKLGHSNFLELCELDLPNCNLQSVELGSSTSFNNLRSLNLEQNNLTHFGGIVNLVHLKVLCLNHNRIETMVPKKPGVSSPLYANKQSESLELPRVLEKLEVLHLGYNDINNLAALQLCRLPSLKALFLQGNEITKVEGLQDCNELRELVLDKNKIKSFNENSFQGQWKLTELHIEENRLRELSYLESLVSLQRLYIGLNRIQDSKELEKLESLTKLFELSVIGNPVAKRLMHRPMLVFKLPHLLSIDGIPVTNDERAKAELYFIEQQGGFQALQAMASSFESTFPGLVTKSKSSVKVSNLSNETYWNPVPHGMTIQQAESQTALQQRFRKNDVTSSRSTNFSHVNRKNYDSRKYQPR